MSGPVILALEGVSKAYGETRAVDGVSLELHAGEFISLLGPSGCGKTTTLHLIAGFVRPDRGRIVLEGRDVTEWPSYRRDLGVVFQSYALFPHMTVASNVAFGLRMRGLGRAEISARVAETLALVRLSGYDQHRPSQLSGGQQQRVALARALVIAPRLLLLDEPLAALDRQLREEMRVELKEIQRRVGVTTLFVTHDQEEALALSDRIGVMSGGRLVQLGPPREVYRRPAARFVAEFIGASSRLPGRIAAVGPEWVTLTLDCGGRAMVARSAYLRTGQPEVGERVDLLVRPEGATLVEQGDGGATSTAAGTVLAGSAADASFLGAVTHLTVRLSCGSRLVLALGQGQASRAPAPGTPVHVAIDVGAALVA